MSQGIELVRRLAAIQERQSRRDFADAIGDLRQAEAQLAALDSERESIRLQLAGDTAKGTQVGLMQDVYRYLDALSRRIDLAAESCVKQRESASIAEDAWITTRHNLKGLENISRRRSDKQRRDRERREQRLADDLHGNRVSAFLDV